MKLSTSRTALTYTPSDRKYGGMKHSAVPSLQSLAAAAKQSYYQQTMTKVWTTEDTLKVLAMLVIASFFFFALTGLFNAEAKLKAKEAKSS
jgi:hypothetical protein